MAGGGTPENPRDETVARSIEKGNGAYRCPICSREHGADHAYGIFVRVRDSPEQTADCDRDSVALRLLTGWPPAWLRESPLKLNYKRRVQKRPQARIEG